MKVDESFWDKQNKIDRKQSAMNCWHCGGEVIWGGDFDYEDYGIDREGIVSNLSCSKCKAYYECYLDLEENKDEEEGITSREESEESKENS
jgi:hypothetical protein